MDSCPKELEPFEKAYKLKKQEKDYLMHMWWGSYGLSAVSVAIEHNFAGKKAKLKYIEEPILQETEKMHSGYKESNEEVAVFEMKQRTKLLRQSGLPESPM